MKRILLAILVLSVASICYAADETEEITLTTYYPAPFGEYDELSVSGNTYLAVDSGNVGIGTSSPGEKLEVDGKVKIGEYSLPNTDGDVGETLITDGSGTISWGNLSGGAVKIASGQNAAHGSYINLVANYGFDGTKPFHVVVGGNFPTAVNNFNPKSVSTINVSYSKNATGFTVTAIMGYQVGHESGTPAQGRVNWLAIQS